MSRAALLGFFASHIPVTLLMDGQASLFRFPYPKAMTDFIQWYATTFQDSHFLKAPNFDPWFASMITWELVFQLPYFFVVVAMLRSTEKRETYPEWFRLLSLYYGASTATTLIPILANNLTNPEPSWSLRVGLCMVYLPYLIFPLWMVKLCWKPTENIIFQPMKGIVYISFFGFFASHIPISVLIDGQVVLPSYLFPKGAVDLLQFYLSNAVDPLMSSAKRTTWFQAVVLMENLFQVPFFCLALYVMVAFRVWPTWFQSICLAYSAQATTAMIAVYATLIAEGAPLSTLGVYFAYVAFPVWLTWICVQASFSAPTKDSAKTKSP